MDTLSDEIWRIITASYAVSLQRLHTILRDLEQHQLRRWAKGRCDLGALAIRIVENLPQSPFALAILKKLSCILNFRDAILAREPSLLLTLLGKAIASDQGYIQYGTVCVALLSLPSKHPLPAEILAFFEAVVQRVIDNPSANTLRPVNSVLSGIGSQTLDALSSDILVRLQRQLIELVSHLHRNTHEINSLCLALLAQIASAEQSAHVLSASPSLTGTNHSQAKPDILEPARKIFADKNVSKILDFVFGRARWACSPSVSETVDHRLEALELCRTTIRPTNEGARQRWLLSKSTLSRKINEHIDRNDLNAEVRCAAIDFIAGVHDPKPIPEGMNKTITAIFRAGSGENCPQLLVENHVAQLDEQSVAAELERLLSLAVLEALPSRESLSNLHVATNLVDILAARCSDSKEIRHMILNCLSTNELSIPIQRFRDFAPANPQEEHTRSGVCPRHYAEIRQDYRQKLCFLILEVGLHAAHDEPSLDTSLTTTLLRKNFAASNSPMSCRACSLPKMTKTCKGVSLFETESTPQEAPSRHWRDQLAESLSRDATYQHQHIVKMLDEVCRDLEARCENAEQPFRDEQTRSRDLDSRLDEASLRIAELTTQNEEYVHSIKVLKVDNSHLNERANAADERSGILAADLREAQKGIELAKEQASNATEASSEAARQKDLTYMAIIKGKDEERKKLSDRIDVLEARISDFTKQLTNHREQEADQARRIKGLEDSLAQRTNDLDKADALADSHLVEMDQLKAANAELLAEKAMFNAKIKETSNGVEALTLRLEAQALAFESEKSELHKKLADRAASNVVEIQKLNQSHRASVRKLQKDHDQVQKNLQRAIKHSSARIKDLEKKATHLRRECDDQEKLLAEYTDFNNHIVSKLRTRQPLPESPAKEIMDDNDNSTRLIPNDGIPSDEETTQRDDGNDLTKFFEPRILSRSGAPTPKRSRISISPAIHNKPPPVVTRKGVFPHPTRRATTGHQKFQRHALQNLGTSSQNEMPLTPTQPSTGKTSRRHTSAAVLGTDENELSTGEAGVREMSFDDSEILTSTCRQRLETSHDYDETTADI